MNKKIRKTQALTNNKNCFRKNLYTALLFINNLYKLEDLLLLKQEEFLKICEVQAIDWSFSPQWLKTDLPLKTEKNLWPFQYTNSLIFKTKNYGELTFYSSQKFSQSKKKFLKKISSFLAVILYSIEDKEKVSNIKKQWVETFDSFYQAFCITDKNFNIIHANQAFQQLFQRNKKDLLCKNLFKIFPFPIKHLENIEREGSLLAQGENNNKKIYWEVSFKTLYLKKENSKVLLFLIKNVSKEMEISAQLSQRAKEQEIGLIKASLAHELNNPIAGIKALLTVIEKEAPSTESSIKEALNEMQTAMDTCHQVVQDLLFASKQEANRMLDQP